MYKLIRFYNQNKKKILKTILIIVFILILIRLLNYLSGININGGGIQYIEQDNNEIYQGLISDKSAISGKTISHSELKKDTDIVGKFIGYCNEGKLDFAYELLSKDCKENMFPTVEDFNNIYCSNLFNNYKTYTIQNWNDKIYVVKFVESALSTGELNNSEIKQDYISVVKEDGEYKLNVNRFIKRQNINKEIEINNIVIKVEKADIYMDFVTYTFDVKNKSYRTILLDDLVNMDTMYVQDSNGVKYLAITNEISQEKLKLGLSQEKKIDIKYYSRYSSNKDIKKIVFSNIITDYGTYKNLRDKNKYGKYLTIEVEV